jgi:predicted transglutaminase-like cysteine proteinase
MPCLIDLKWAIKIRRGTSFMKTVLGFINAPSVHLTRSTYLFFSILIFQGILLSKSVPFDSTYSIKICQNSVSYFIQLMREYDLNYNVQDGYAITKKEYQHLHNIWQNLIKTREVEIVRRNVNRLFGDTFVIKLICDLSNNTVWESHFRKMKVGSTLEYSLTLSRFDSPLTLELAHMTLVDLLNHGPKMFDKDTFLITEEILTAAEKRMGSEARLRLKEWEQIINELKHHSSAEVIATINEYFNKTVSQEVDDRDEKEYDYWQSPIETLVKGSGDCEDFAMAKYVSLRLLGIPAEQLLIGLVHYPEYNDTHAVLLFFPKDDIDPLVLDNVVYQHLGYMNSHILTLSHRMIKHNITPIIGFNEEKFVSFTNDLNQKLIGTDPCNEYRQFGIAVNNSNRVLP